MYQHPPPLRPPSPNSKRMRMDIPGGMPRPAYASIPPQQQVPQPPPPPPPPQQLQAPPAQAPPQMLMPSAPHMSAHQSVLLALEDEDMAAATDDLDVVSARDIATSRYARHHEWMEQVLGSAYASAKILPPPLFAGLLSAGATGTSTAASGGAGATGTANVWGGMEALKARVQELREEVNAVDEFYTRMEVEVREMHAERDEGK
ncbi:uncharacterized protein V1518DRAFT_427441 [Limtongia smithiae]|uniref:uncharacterized protein n=1 Tax=Limtongia smithiae TaxID=1125753 RepID=UPI0034CDFC66